MQVFAHRGASAKAPENTLKAIEYALESHCTGVEIDIHSADGELFVIHDRYLQRTTNGQGAIARQSVEYISGLDAGNGQKVPILWQVLQLIQGRCQLNIELKGVTEVTGLLALLDRACNQLGFCWSQFLLSSFDHHLLAELKRRQPQIRLGALTASKPIEYAAFAEKLSAYSVNLDINCVDLSFVEDAKRRGLKVFVYTVDEPQDINMLFNWQVDAIFSNDPQKAIEVIKQLK